MQPRPLRSLNRLTILCLVYSTAVWIVPRKESLVAGCVRGHRAATDGAVVWWCLYSALWIETATAMVENETSATGAMSAVDPMAFAEWRCEVACNYRLLALNSVLPKFGSTKQYLYTAGHTNCRPIILARISCWYFVMGFVVWPLRLDHCSWIHVRAVEADACPSNVCEACRI